MIRKNVVLLGCLLIFVLSFSFALTVGTISYSFSEVFSMLFFNGGTEQNRLILQTFRIPRVVIACLIGVALSVSGDILQKITRNPIADAGILGVSSGVAFGGVFYYYLVGSYLEQLQTNQHISLMFFGLLGAIFAMVLNLLLSFNFGKLNMSRFILNGIGISSGFSALVTFFSLKINADDYSRVNNWLQGSITHVNWEKCYEIGVWVIPALIVTFILYPKLTMLKFDDNHLNSIGFKTTLWRLIFILLAALMICASVLTAGTIGFVGLIVPALTRMLTPKTDRFYLVALSLNGMSILILCDLFARTLFTPNELPLNAMMGILGIPYLVFLFFQSKKGNQ